MLSPQMRLTHGGVALQVVAKQMVSINQAIPDIFRMWRYKCNCIKPLHWLFKHTVCT